MDLGKISGKLAMLSMLILCALTVLLPYVVEYYSK